MQRGSRCQGDTRETAPDTEREKRERVSRPSFSSFRSCSVTKHSDRRQAAAGGHAASHNPAGLDGWTDGHNQEKEGRRLTDGDDHPQDSHGQVLAHEEVFATSWRGKGERTESE